MQTVIKNPNWWRRRTTLERCLTLLSIFALIAVIGLIVGLISVLINQRGSAHDHIMDAEAVALHSPHDNSDNEIQGGKITKNSVASNADGICLTKGCIHAASELLSKMKLETEPCDDFYDFVCGGYNDANSIPDDKVTISTFTVIVDKLQTQLKDLIKDTPAESEPKYYQYPNMLYKSCMDIKKLDKLDSKPIMEISEKLGGWPVLKGEHWDPNNTWTWEEAVFSFRKHGFSIDYIIDFSISVDYKNTTKRVIDFDQASLGLSREYITKGLSDNLTQAYYSYMVDLAVLFGGDKATAEKELLESLQFETKLAEISWPNEKRRNSTALYNLRTIKEVQENYGYIEWLKYINAILPESVGKITEDEIINLSVPSYLKDLEEILQQTPKRVIANYMMFRVHAFAVTFLSERFRKRQFQYFMSVSGREEQESRWKECVDISTASVEEEFDGDGGLSIAVGSLYARKYFNEASKHDALEMVKGIRETFGEILDETIWMDPETKLEAKKKLKGMTTHIAYPDELLDQNKLATYYDKLELAPGEFFESMIKMNIFGTDKAFNKLREPVNKTDWVRHARPAVVNAYYSSVENSIQFPAGILQGHFFSADRPKYLNYGAIGYVIGHEITHGFDDQGRMFNLEGNLHDWWKNETAEAYLEKAQCIIWQYGNYTEPLTGLKLNGINTQGENIADNGGIKQAYRAYRTWAEKNGREASLPGLPYTPEQLFWISAGQTWCSKYRKAAMNMRITTGNHSPSDFRVLGPFSNYEAFAKDFNCPEGSVMNPVHRCTVW